MKIYKLIVKLMIFGADVSKYSLNHWFTKLKFGADISKVSSKLLLLLQCQNLDTEILLVVYK